MADDKCPQCGAERDAVAATCPACGFVDEERRRAEEIRERALNVARRVLDEAQTAERENGELAAERQRRAEEERRRELEAARPKREGDDRMRTLEDGIRQVEETAEEVLGNVLAAGRASAERERKLEAIIRREQKAAQETLAEEAAAKANAATGADKPAKADLPDLMRCPFCKEMVLSNAGTCPGCGTPIVPGLFVPGLREERPRRGRGCLLFFLFCLGFLTVLGFFALRVLMQTPPR